jgi:hypothetical protein
MVLAFQPCKTRLSWFLCVTGFQMCLIVGLISVSKTMRDERQLREMLQSQQTREKIEQLNLVGSLRLQLTQVEAKCSVVERQLHEQVLQKVAHVVAPQIIPALGSSAFQVKVAQRCRVAVPHLPADWSGCNRSCLIAKLDEFQEEKAIGTIKRTMCLTSASPCKIRNREPVRVGQVREGLLPCRSHIQSFRGPVVIGSSTRGRTCLTL